jgi:hypothetical protein
MDKLEIIEITNPLTQIVEEFVIIDRGNGEYTSMLKSTYDEMIAAQANQLTL